MKIELEIAETLYSDLQMIAAETDTTDLAQIVITAVEVWLESRKAELANRDPGQRYFVNEALDDLLERQKKPD